jgi:ribosomal protein S21|tara:strand:+ start:1426 stop:1689 length:264 start_codon:yes stop_codon:yes gene_type:complete
MSVNKKHKIWQSHIPGHANGAAVVKNPNNPHDGGDIGFAIRFWKRAMKDHGTIEELKERKHFIKKSAKNREKMKNARYFQKINSIEE